MISVRRTKCSQSFNTQGQSKVEPEREGGKLKQMSRDLKITCTCSEDT